MTIWPSANQGDENDRRGKKTREEDKQEQNREMKQNHMVLLGCAMLLRLVDKHERIVIVHHSRTEQQITEIEHSEDAHNEREKESNGMKEKAS